ncbi:hypothetical protein [uncultured Muribaculum sp.]|uniref:hypothetical protein n=1 Tax=uncultured Muribaculum sp. TaxID=1918613 RepID=UPI0025F4F3E5|nr:hypothetical protein [uncultured Muribaculum sp.]
MASFAFLGGLSAKASGNPACKDLYTLKKTKKALGDVFYHGNRSKLLDFSRIDNSDLFEIYLTPTDYSSIEDCDKSLSDGDIRLNPDVFRGNIPANGVLGDDFRRIEVYFYPDMVKIDSLTYAVRGRTKVKTNVCDFTGHIRIKKIFRGIEHDMDSTYSYSIIAEYLLKEDASQKGSGELRGILQADACTLKDTPDVVRIDESWADADGYFNRTFVGTWRSYNDPALVKRCMWGDYRLPFCFDFDIGDGEMMVNPDYASPEWDRWMYRKDIELILSEDGVHYNAKYRNPWW